MSRSAFIGLSGPIGYDYRNSTDKSDPRDTSAPNPILEDGLGLMVLSFSMIKKPSQALSFSMSVYTRSVGTSEAEEVRFPVALLDDEDRVRLRHQC